VTAPAPPGSTGTDQTFAPALLGTFRDGVSLIEQGIKSIRDAWNGVIDAINGFFQRVNEYLDNRHFWQKPFDWLFDDISDGIDKIRAVIASVQEKIDSILDTMQKSVNGSIPVFSLFEVGMDWATKVNTPLSDLAPDLSPVNGKLANWRGPAHETYKDRVADQGDAIAAVVEKVSATSTWLSGVGQANVDFIADLGSQAADIVSTLTSVGADVAETAATDVAGVVQASNHASEGAGDAVALIVTYLASLASRLADVLARINELANSYGNHIGLPGGQWPEAVNA
jgi:hypothetical protein